MSETIRCFFAIPLPDALKDEIAQYLTKFRQIYPKIKWVRAGALHITLKFLGNIPPILVEKVILQTMACGENVPGFSIGISGFGAFPNKNKPRVIWLGVQSHPHQPLYILQQTLERELYEIGIEREQRRFSPHLTLGRVKYPDDMTKLWQYIDQHPFPKVEYSANEILLMRSLLKPDGAQYRTLQKYPLRRSG